MMTMTLDAWVAANKPGPTMLWRDAAGGQFEAWNACEVAAEPGTMRVIGEHRSKSIALPVVEVKIERLGLRIIMRDNFYNLAVTVESTRPIGFAPPEPWGVSQSADYMHECYFEGFERAGVRVYKESLPGDPRVAFSFHAWGKVQPVDLVLMLIAEAARSACVYGAAAGPGWLPKQ